MLVHQAVRLGCCVRGVRVLDQVVSAAPILRRRRFRHVGGEGLGSVAVGGQRTTHLATAPLSICLGCVSCRAWNPMAAFSTAWKKYATAWVDSVAMCAMKSVRVN